MPVVFCGLCPHPPIMVPAVGGKKSEIVINSRQAMLELGRRLKESGAQSMVFISPHGPVFRDGIAINMVPALKGDLGRFGTPEVSFNMESDLKLATDIGIHARNGGITTIGMDEKDAGKYKVSLDLDHGFTVPLHFLSESGVNLPMVAIYMGLLPLEQLYAFGMAIRQAADQSGKKVAVIASGDLSHRLISDAPAGYDPKGEEFDREMVRLLGLADVSGFLNLDPDLVERAGECGLRPIIMMLGALDGYAVESDVLSYEGPFGVGYAVATFNPRSVDQGRQFVQPFRGKIRAGEGGRNGKEGFLPGVARAALEYYSRGEKYQVPPDVIPDEFNKPAGVFVSLKINGQLRGCIGTVFPQQDSVIEETIQNAISAGHRDPRFYPLKSEELDNLEISVDVLGEPDPVADKKDLDPMRFGVIVRSGRKSGLLLPNLEGVNTVEEQIAIASQKAGISTGEPIRLERFEVIRHK